jgi:hypothetical protein
MLIHGMKDVDLHAGPHGAAVLRRVDVDAGIAPALHKELAAEIEVLVLAGGAEPCWEAAAFVHHDVAVLLIKGGFGAILDSPVIEGCEAGFVGGLRRREEGGNGTGGGQKIPSVHTVSIVLGGGIWANCTNLRRSKGLTRPICANCTKP